jgi:hypothetical protein
MAIAVRVLIPQGFMVVAGEHPGAVAIALCADQGVVQASAGHHHDEARDASPAPGDADDGFDGKAPCAFAGLHAFAAVEPAGFAALEAWPATARPVALSTRAAPSRALATRPPSTGPPGRA